MTQLVFVGGAGRSGTTFFAHALARFEGVSTGVESQWVYELISAEVDQPEWVDFTRNHWKIRTSPRQPSSNQWKELEGIAEKGDIATFCGRLLRVLAHEDAGVIVDHTPTNILHHPTLRETFPRAKFLHIVRDGRAVYASLKKVKWGPNSPYAAADYWLRFLAHGLLAEQTLSPDTFRRVHYETLVRDPEAIVGIAEWIQGASVSYRERLSESSEPSKDMVTEIPRYTREQHALVNRPPDPARIDAWRNHLTRREIAAFEQRTNALLTYLGYDLVCHSREAPGRIYRAMSRLKETAMELAINPLRNAIRTRGEHYC